MDRLYIYFYIWTFSNQKKVLKFWMLNKSFCLEASLNIIIIINNKHRVLWRLKNRVIAKVLGRTLSWAGPPGTSIPLPSQEMVLACDVALPGGSQPGAALPLDPFPSGTEGCALHNLEVSNVACLAGFVTQQMQLSQTSAFPRVR